MAEPWSKFFWSDYEADEGLRICSLAAQGLWMRMLCVMARATPKGELRIGSEPCSIQDLARLVSESDETVAALLDQLRRRGVFSTTRAGVIFSRRLRKDAEISRKRAENGTKGAMVTHGNKGLNSGLPRQKAGKPSGKSLAPEARSQKPERKTPLPPNDSQPPGEPEKPDAEGGGKYAFDGYTIRLTQPDLDRWQASFHAIPDLRAELAALDAWFTGKPEEVRRRWFHSAAANLSKKHQAEMAARQRDGPDTLVDVINRREDRRAKAMANGGMT